MAAKGNVSLIESENHCRLAKQLSSLEDIRRSRFSWENEFDCLAKGVSCFSPPVA